MWSKILISWPCRANNCSDCSVLLRTLANRTLAFDLDYYLLANFTFQSINRSQNPRKGVLVIQLAILPSYLFIYQAVVTPQVR